MTDVSELLAEFDAPAEVSDPGRYIPNPADFAAGNARAANEGWEGLKSVGNDFLEQGLTPSVLGRGLWHGANYLASPLVGLGEYLGNPVRNIVGDSTGSKTAGDVVGNTVALAPLMMAPFPRTSLIRGGGEAMGAMIGEAPAARSVVEGAQTLLESGGRAAPEQFTAEDMMASRPGIQPGEVARTSHQPKAPVDWYRQQFQGNPIDDQFPAPGGEAPRDIRLKDMSKQNGSNVIQGYFDHGSNPTLRTSHEPKMPVDEAPIDWYENQFRVMAPGEQPAGQMPLYPGREVPGVRPGALAEMHLPQVRHETRGDPNLEAELALKFGGRTPERDLTGTKPWLPGPEGPPAPFPNQNAGVRPPAQSPIPGAYPMDPPQTNVIFPNEFMPVSMGTEARANTNRLREDLGVPTDPNQPPSPRTRVTSKAKLAEAPQEPEVPVTPANTARDVTKFGSAEVGKDYDIVHTMGGNELRATGGRVVELVEELTPQVVKGKTEMMPQGFAILEDGRKVPAKLLQPKAGTNVEAAPATMPAKMSGSSSPISAPQEAADPALAAIGKSVREKAAPKKKMMTYDEAAKASDAEAAKRKLHSDTAKERSFVTGLNAVRGTKKNVPLKNLDPFAMSKKTDVEVKTKTVIDSLNKMIKSGDVKIYDSKNPKGLVNKVRQEMLNDDSTYVVKFLKDPKEPPSVKGLGPDQPKKKAAPPKPKVALEEKPTANKDRKAKQAAKKKGPPKPSAELTKRLNSGEITGTEFLDELRREAGNAKSSGLPKDNTTLPKRSVSDVEKGQSAAINDRYNKALAYLESKGVAEQFKPALDALKNAYMKRQKGTDWLAEYEAAVSKIRSEGLKKSKGK